MHPQITLSDLAPEDIARFWGNVDRCQPEECWNYRRRLSHRYPQMKVRGRWYIVSRLSWTLAFGPIPDGLQVCHHCDNSRCVNPAHLFLGTQKDNEADKCRKGRQARGERQGTHTRPDSVRRGERHWSRYKPESLPRGDRNGSRKHPERVARGDRHGKRLHPESLLRGEQSVNARLTQAQVDEVRQMYASGAYTKTDIARQFHVNRTTVARIIAGKTWRTVS